MPSTWTDIMESNWELLHLGYIVKDLDKTLEYYQSLGLVSAYHEFPKERHRISVKIHGKPKNPPNPSRKGPGKQQIIRMGPLPLELIQVGEGSSDPNSEFFDTRGEGIAHIGFIVDDIEAETAKLVEKGVDILFTLTVDDRETMHYFDTRKYGGLVLELLQRGTWGDQQP